VKEKYVVEKFPRWFIFGENIVFDTVDVSNGGGDVITGVDRKAALRLIEEHNKVVDALVDALTKED
jgi:hypothetical protein